jgi:hypothetical protein
MDWHNGRAVANGYLAVAQWLYSNASRERCSTYSIDTVAANGHQEMLQWLESENLFQCSTGAGMEIVKWLRE